MAWDLDSAILKSLAQIVSGEVSPIEGARKLWDLSLETEAYGHSLDTFIYAASEWDEPSVTEEMHAQWGEAIIEAARELLAARRA